VQDRLGAMPDLTLKLDEMKSRLEDNDFNFDFDLDPQLQQKLSDLDMKMDSLKINLPALGDLAFLQAPKAPPPPPPPPPRYRG
jgi:hypothetical protein